MVQACKYGVVGVVAIGTAPVWVTVTVFCAAAYGVLIVGGCRAVDAMRESQILRWLAGA